MREARLMFAVCLGLLQVPCVFGETPVGGTIGGDRWAKENSPYRVVADINATDLVIEPGVRVEFTGDFTFEVTGVLRAVGTPEESIVFARAAGAAERWWHIFFNRAREGCELVHCDISGAHARGISVVDCAPRIEHCRVWDNQSYATSRNNGIADGAGIYLQWSLSTPAPLITLRECVVEHNTVNSQLAIGGGAGGGIYINGASVALERCVIRWNRCNAVSSWCGASPFASGGGIIAYPAGNLTLANCVVTDNIAYARMTAYCDNAGPNARGGGLYFAQGSLTIRNSIMGQNQIATEGPNKRYAEGAGLHVGGGTVVLQNCAIARNNLHGISRAGGTVTVSSSIIYFNGAPQISGGATVTYSCVEGGYSGTGNMFANPGFAGLVDCHDLRLAPGSACIDAGSPSGSMNDACPVPGPANVRNDMGAYGGPVGCETPHVPDCDLDYNDDLLEIERGLERDLDKDGILDTCEIRDDPSLDENGNSILDAVERVSGRLVPAQVPGKVAWDIVLSCDVPIRGAEIALIYATALLKVAEVTRGADLTAGCEFDACPPACGAAGPASRCGGGTAGITMAWRTPNNAGDLWPAGSYTVGRIAFTIVPTVAAGTVSPLDFVEQGCLGLADAPNRNVFTDESGQSVPFVGLDVVYDPGYFRRGEVNGDGVHDISDPITILLCLFLRPDLCPACPDSADADDNGKLEITDAVHLFRWRFQGGSQPPGPFPACGFDPTRDDVLEDCVFSSCY